MAFLPKIGFAESRISQEETHIEAVKAIGTLFEEYHREYGTYPYSENWENTEDGFAPVSIVCNLSVNEIPKKLAYPPYSCALFSPRDVEKYLSKALKRKVVLPKDNRPLKHNNRDIPFFYVILIKENEYYVSCYLNFSHDGTRQLGKYWHKFEVGSVAVPEKKIWEMKKLIKNKSNQ